MLKLPAIAPEAASILISNDEAYVREKGELLHPNCKDKKVLDETKETLGSHGFQAQYQQDPVPQATAGFGQKQSLTETMRKVRLQIRKMVYRGGCA